MQINQVFDELYDDYTAKIIRWVPYYQQMVNGLAQHLPETFRPQRILDLGCGNGNASQVLLKAFPEAAFHLVDASAEMIEGCRERFSGKGNFQYQQCFFQDLNFEAEQFDLIVACLSIHHLHAPEKQQFFAQMRPWLRPGACFLYSDLMISKNNLEFHSEHMEQWKKDAFSQGTNDEEWQFLMEHYNTYDHPSALKDQLNWLNQAAFNTVEVPFRTIGWTTIKAGV